VETLANHKSAIKRNIQNNKRRLRNRSVKTRVKSVVKTVRLAEKQGDAETISGKLNAAQAVIDKAAKKGVIHPKTAARKISRLYRRANRGVSA
jgi:small subunit ribosomal protein S20